MKAICCDQWQRGLVEKKLAEENCGMVLFKAQASGQNPDTHFQLWIHKSKGGWADKVLSAWANNHPLFYWADDSGKSVVVMARGSFDDDLMPWFKNNLPDLEYGFI